MKKSLNDGIAYLLVAYSFVSFVFVVVDIRQQYKFSKMDLEELKKKLKKLENLESEGDMLKDKPQESTVPADVSKGPLNSNQEPPQEQNKEALPEIQEAMNKVATKEKQQDKL